MSHIDQLVGINETAKLAQVSRQAVANWRARFSDFPNPISELASGPVFRRSQILAWLIKKGKIVTRNCPICDCPIEHSKTTDYGERMRIFCLNCGEYEISATALAMLESRIEQNSMARARLSHAIRTGLMRDEHQFISSTNLDELICRPLPGVEQQVDNLVMWLAAELDENRFGQTVYGFPELLAGVAGATNGDGVQQLIAYGVECGILSHDSENGLLGLTPAGWSRLEGAHRKRVSENRIEKVGVQDVDKPSRELETVQSNCNHCGGLRNSFVRAKHCVGEDDTNGQPRRIYETVECCGCSNVSNRKTTWYRELDKSGSSTSIGSVELRIRTETEYWPPATRRKKPIWSEKLPDRNLKIVLKEVYQALDFGHVILASIGARTLLDRAMFLIIDDPQSGFREKLAALKNKGYISESEKGTLSVIIDAGNAAAHRGFAPSAGTLLTIIDAIENFFYRHFILRLAAEEVRKDTPRRGD